MANKLSENNVVIVFQNTLGMLGSLGDVVDDLINGNKYRKEEAYDERNWLNIGSPDTPKFDKES